jgi:hypothetical protein
MTVASDGIMHRILIRYQAVCDIAVLFSSILSPADFPGNFALFGQAPRMIILLPYESSCFAGDGTISAVHRI